MFSNRFKPSRRGVLGGGLVLSLQGLLAACGVRPALPPATTTAVATEAAAKAATAAATEVATTAVATEALVAAPASVATPACVVRPAMTEGPYFLDDMLNRVDVRGEPSDGSVRPGAELALTFRVVQRCPTPSSISGTAMRPASTPASSTAAASSTPPARPFCAASR
jgi:hypothetical protein